MGCFSGLMRLLLVILNVALLVAFGAMAIVGMLIRFNEGYLMSLLGKAVEKWPVSFLHDLINLIQNFGGPVSIVLITVGLFVVIVSIMGIFALLCKVKCLAKIYLIGISLLSILELALIIYLYAIPGNLDKFVEKLLTKTLNVYGQDDKLGKASISLWKMIGEGEGGACCGMTGYEDFPEGQPLPPSCCTKKQEESSSQEDTCNTEGAKSANVKGCKEKIDDYVEQNKTVYIAVPCGLFAFQLIVLIIMGALCPRWHRDD